MIPATASGNPECMQAENGERGGLRFCYFSAFIHSEAAGWQRVQCTYMRTHVMTATDLGEGGLYCRSDHHQGAGLCGTIDDGVRSVGYCQVLGKQRPPNIGQRR